MGSTFSSSARSKPLGTDALEREELFMMYSSSFTSIRSYRSLDAEITKQKIRVFHRTHVADYVLSYTPVRRARSTKKAPKRAERQTHTFVCFP